MKTRRKRKTHMHATSPPPSSRSCYAPPPPPKAKKGGNITEEGRVSCLSGSEGRRKGGG